LVTFSLHSGILVFRIMEVRDYMDPNPVACRCKSLLFSFLGVIYYHNHDLLIASVILDIHLFDCYLVNLACQSEYSMSLNG
jgi:hypothetical protein